MTTKSQRKCPLTSEEYLALLAAVSESLCREIEGVSWLVERTADLDAPEKAKTISVFIAIHKQRMEIEHALKTLGLLSTLGHDDWHAEFVNEYEIAVAAFDRALQDFEDCFLSTNGRPASEGDSITDQLARLEIELTRYRNLPERVANLLKKEVLHLENEKRREHQEKLDNLTEKQADFYEIASETKPLRGIEIARQSIHEYDSQGKAALSDLVKLGLLEKVRGGYRRVPIPDEKSQD